MLPVQWRICTKFKPENAVIPSDAPSSTMYPAGFMWTLLTSRISMLFTSGAAESLERRHDEDFDSPNQPRCS
jgi:hypothetical protein